MKTIHLSYAVYNLTEEYPELIEILADIGFLGVKNPKVRKTVGSRMTIPAGCKLQRKPLKEVLDCLRSHGFEVVDD